MFPAAREHKGTFGFHQGKGFEGQQLEDLYNLDVSLSPIQKPNSHGDTLNSMELNYDTYVYKIQDFGFGLCTFNICNRRMEKRKEKEAKNVLSISFLFTSSICFFHCKETIISTITVAFFKQIQFCHTFSSVCKLL